MEEEQKKKNRNELYGRMYVVRLDHRKNFGNQFKYIRGTGLVKRDDE